MQILSSNLHHGNTANRQRRVNSASSRRQSAEPFTMVEDSIDALGLNGSVQMTYRKLKRVIRLCGGECDWPERRLLAYLGMKESTFTSHRRQLEAVGLIVVTRRRRFGCRQNDTNIYRLSEGGSKICPQKSTEKYLKTNTPTRENPREAYEARVAKDREDHERKAQEYAAVGQTIKTEVEQRIAAREENRRYWREGARHRWAGGRQYRLERAMERTNRAGVGTPEALNRVHGGVPWEVRFPEEAAMVDCERRKREGLNGQESKTEGAPKAVERADLAEHFGCGKSDFAGVRGEAGSHPCRHRGGTSDHRF